jgi:hypothetical protein
MCSAGEAVRGRGADARANARNKEEDGRIVVSCCVQCAVSNRAMAGRTLVKRDGASGAECEGTKRSSGQSDVQHRRPGTSSCCMLAGTDPTALQRRALDIALDHAPRCSLAPLPLPGPRCPRFSVVHRHLRVPSRCCSAPRSSTPALRRPCPQPTSSLALPFTLGPQDDCRKGQAAHTPAAQGTSLTLTSPGHVCTSSAPLTMAPCPLRLRNHC